MSATDHVCPRCGATAPTAGACDADGERLVARGTDALLGTTIGRYRVAKLVGRGGMGRVYLGVQPDIGAKVAIKVLLEADNDGRRVERFFAEARAVNVVRHEHIVDVLDLGTFPDGVPYMVMELVEGAPLATLIANRSPLPIGSVCRLVSEVLSALAATHEKGIYHRDLKPDNVMVTPAGHPKILDFGIAKLDRDGQKLTGTGVFVGTPLYAAPEQVRGAAADGRADLYAVGVVLFEALTGRTPFVSDSLYGLLEKHATEPPPAPSSLRPDLPPAIEAVVLKALAKTPEARYPTARAMAAALEEAARDLPREANAPLHAAANEREPPARGGGFSRTGVDLGPKDTSPTPSGLASPPRPEPAAATPATSPKRTFAAALAGVLVVGLSVGYIVRARVLASPDPVEAAPSAAPSGSSVAVVASADAAPPCRDERCVPIATTLRRVDPVVLLPEVTQAARTLEAEAVFAGLLVLETADGLVDVTKDTEGGATAAFLFRVPMATAEHGVVIASPRGGSIGVNYMKSGGAEGVAARAATRPPTCSAGRAVAASIVAGLRASENKTLSYHRALLGGSDGWEITDLDAAERWVDGKTCQVGPGRQAPKPPAAASSARPSPQEIRRLQAEAIRDRKPIPQFP